MRQNVRNFLEREGIGTKTQSRLKDFWAFRAFITPVVAQILFWSSVMFALIAGIFIALEGIIRHQNLETIIGISLILFGPVLIRMQFEVIVVIFRINESLDELKKERQ